MALSSEIDYNKIDENTYSFNVGSSGREGFKTNVKLSLIHRGIEENALRDRLLSEGFKVVEGTSVTTSSSRGSDRADHNRVTWGGDSLNITSRLDHQNYYVNASGVVRISKLTQLTVRSEPTGADVTLAGKIIGTTPFDIGLMPDTYTLTFEKAEYKPEDIDVTIDPTMANEVSVVLTKIEEKGLLEILTDAFNAIFNRPAEDPAETIRNALGGLFGNILATLVDIFTLPIKDLEGNIIGRIMIPGGGFRTVVKGVIGDAAEAGLDGLLMRLNIGQITALAEKTPAVAKAAMSAMSKEELAVLFEKLGALPEGRIALFKLLNLAEKEVLEKILPAAVTTNPKVTKLISLLWPDDPWKKLYRVLFALAGADAIATWLSSDNIITGTGFTMNKLRNAVESGAITKEQALADVEHVQGWKDFATNFVNVSTFVNPLLWLFRGVFMTNTELAQVNIDLVKSQIEILPEPGEPPVEPIPPTEPEVPETPPGEETPDPTKPIIPGKAYITIVSSPPGATIWIDGKTTYTVTPFVHILSAGKHNIQLQLFKYKPTFETVDIEADKSIIKTYSLEPVEVFEPEKPFIPVPIEIPLEEIPPVEVKPNAWEVTITARNSDTGEILNAKIIIDGIYTGKYTTNSVILEPASRYLLRLEAFGYLPGETYLDTDPLP